MIDSSKILITGASGMVGSACNFGIKLSRQDLDVADFGRFKKKVLEHKPSAIFHFAGADLRTCESLPLQSIRSNIEGARNAALVAKNEGIPLVFLSSGTVFNGHFGEIFSEQCLPDPQQIYGLTKFLAENWILDIFPHALVIRTGWLFGGHGSRQKKLADIILENIKENTPIRATKFQTGSHTYVADLISEILNQLNFGTSGIRHIVNSNCATAYDLASYLCEKLGHLHLLEEQKVVTSGPIRRSASEALRSDYIFMRDWTDALDEYVSLKLG